MKRIIFAIALICGALTANAQHSLQFDNAAGFIGVIDGSLLTANRTFKLPNTSGTIVSFNGPALTINGNSLTWPTTSAGYLYNNGSGGLSWAAGGGGTLTGGGTAGQMAYWDGGTSLTGSTNLTYNGTTLASAANSAGNSALTASNSSATGTAATFSAPTTGGIALALASGKMTLSTETVVFPNSGTTIPIVGGAVMVVITDNGVDGTDKTITFPTGVDGQVLIILNNDTNDKANTGGGALGGPLDTTAKELGMFIYYSGTWHRMD